MDARTRRDPIRKAAGRRGTAKKLKSAHETFQMLVGTIGIPRKEVLYELTLAEIILITRGYFARFRPSWEQARMIAYFARYAMGSKTTPPSIQEWFPLPWEKEQEPELTDEQVEEIRQRLIEENERNAKCQK